MSNPHDPSDLSSDSDASLTSVQQSTVSTLLQVFGHIMRYATVDWVKLDLSSAQIKVLNSVYYGAGQEGYTVNQLADRLNVGASTASHLIDKLVQAGLAVRVDSLEDRRTVHVTLSAAGNDMARALWGGRDAIVAHWITQLAVDDLNTLNQGIQALHVIAQNSEQTQPTDG